MRSRLISLIAGAALSVGIVGSVAAQNVPSAEPQGCHGAATLAYKQSVGSPSQAEGILAQVRSDLGRGETLQQFLAASCGVGRYAD
jgi:hypothetical protein